VKIALIAKASDIARILLIITFPLFFSLPESAEDIRAQDMTIAPIHQLCRLLRLSLALLCNCIFQAAQGFHLAHDLLAWLNTFLLVRR
jgi:hypothetical protein